MALSNNMSVFTTSIKNNSDLLKNYLFQVIFEYEEGGKLSKIIGTDDFMLRAKSATLPTKTFNQLNTEYMGTKLVFPGKPTVDGTFTVQFDEFQDMYISKALHRWQNLIGNTGFQNDIDVNEDTMTGGASSNYMKDYSATVRVVLFDSTKKTKLPIEYRFYYVWPTTLEAANLDMNGQDKVTRSCSFQYSTFECVATGE